jgi:hypothetical protein
MKKKKPRRSGAFVLIDKSRKRSGRQRRGRQAPAQLVTVPTVMPVAFQLLEPNVQVPTVEPPLTARARE